tara:strand:- start:51 stop:368 length:318 start_codon:yes stop_codon:yes gene_type:complete
MIVGRIVAWILLALALMALGAEIVRSLEAGAWEILALGPLWYAIDPAGLNVTQAVIQRYLLTELWDPVIVTLLTWPAWVVFAVPGLLLLALFRRRRQPNRRWFKR